jgi:4-diphosphocytidyl-2C-methyl-D-erythritol kinase
MITIVAPAKINLFLRICRKTDAGYHLLDSAIAFTHFGDHLTIEPANDDQLAIIGEFASGLESADDNLVMTALRGFRAAGGLIGGLSITLEKNIPVGAGLSMPYHQCHLVRTRYITLLPALAPMCRFVLLVAANALPELARR